MNDERLAELKEKYKDRNLVEELAWGVYANHSGYTSKQNGEFLNWLCLMAYKALKERPQGEWIPVSERLPEINKDVIVTDVETDETYSAYYLGDGLWVCDNGAHRHRIIAWKSFPEPYTKGGAE